MPRTRTGSLNKSKERPSWEILFWERFRTRLYGTRTPQELGQQLVGLLLEEYRPGICFLGAQSPTTQRWSILCVGRSGREAPSPPSPEEQVLLLEQWKGSMQEASGKEDLMMMRDGDETHVLVPLRALERVEGVLVLGKIVEDLMDDERRRALGGLGREVGERLFLLSRREEADEETPQEIEAPYGLRAALEEERRRSRELESLLVQITQEEAKRARELEQVTDQWLSMKTFTESVLQSMNSGVISVDQRGRITYINRGAEKILQYGADEVLGKPLSSAMASKDKRDLLAMKGGEEEELSMGRQIRVMRKDGVEIPIGFTISPHKDAQGREIGKIIHFRDLTKINEMQEEILRMDRLVSLGEISMGIAHEIRNPLAGIRITAQALEEEVSDNPNLREYASRIITEIDRLNELLKSFFSFAKPQRPQLLPCNLPKLVEEVLVLLRKDMEKRAIRVEEEYEGSIPSLHLDPNQIKQVLLNLILNAIQAIGRDGWIRIQASLRTTRRRREVVLAVSDSGKGISPEHQAKIFDPFFTTKAKGLGLGLSISYRIVKRHGGTIRVQSEPAKGTTFYLHFPVDTDAQQKNGSASLATHPHR